MIRLVLAASILLLATACGKSDDGTVPKNAQETADVLTGDAKGSAADNPVCKLFTNEEAGAYIGEPVTDGQNAGAGTGCQWPAKDDSGDAMVVVVPADFAEVPSLADGYKEVPGVGEKGFVVPELGGFAAGAVVGKEFVKASVAGSGASADQAVALLKETIKRRG